MTRTNRNINVARVCLVAALCVTLFLYHHYVLNADSEKAQLRKYAHEISDQIKTKLLLEIYSNERTVDSIGRIVEKTLTSRGGSHFDSARTKRMVLSLLTKKPNLDGAYIVFEKEGHPISSKQYYSVYINHEDERHVEQKLSILYGTALQLSNAPWHLLEASKKKRGWVGPYLSTVADKRTTSYLTSISIGNGVRCYIGVDYSSVTFFGLLNGWKSGRVGYPYLMNRKGAFVAHPSNDTRTLMEIGKAYNESSLVSLANAIEKGEDIDPLQYYHLNTVSKSMCWEHIQHIKHTDWFLGISVADQQIYSNPIFFNQQRQQKILYSFLFFGGLLLIEVIMLLALFRRNDFFLLLSWALILFFAVEIGLLYHICLKYPTVKFSDMEITRTATQKSKFIEVGRNASKDTQMLSRWFDRWNFAMLLDNDGTNDYISLYKKSLKEKQTKPTTLVPTGLYLLTVSFTDSYTSKLSGYVWQIYPHDSNLKPGVIFPDAETSTITLKDSATVITQNGQKATFYQWRFEVEIREQFDYSQFPLDYNDLWIRIWTADFQRNVILTPAFGSYVLLHPSFRPGLDNDIIIPGWIIEGSYFSYKEKNYSTSLGSGHAFFKEAFPELHYNIILKRDCLDSIITRITPIIVLLFMTYSILYIAKRKDALDVAIACAGLLFVAVFEHVNLRRSLDTSGIIYMEYYYFTTYLMLMLVSVNTILNNRFSKHLPEYLSFSKLTIMMYWPLTLLIILVATFITFY